MEFKAECMRIRDLTKRFKRPKKSKTVGSEVGVSDLIPTDDKRLSAGHTHVTL